MSSHNSDLPLSVTLSLSLFLYFCWSCLFITLVKCLRGDVGDEGDDEDKEKDDDTDNYKDKKKDQGDDEDWLQGGCQPCIFGYVK